MMNATASYLATHRNTGRLATPDAAIFGYTVAFTVAAIVFAVAAVLAFGLLPLPGRQQAAAIVQNRTHVEVKSPLPSVVVRR